MESNQTLLTRIADAAAPVACYDSKPGSRSSQLATHKGQQVPEQQGPQCQPSDLHDSFLLSPAF